MKTQSNPVIRATILMMFIVGISALFIALFLQRIEYTCVAFIFIGGACVIDIGVQESDEETTPLGDVPE